MGAGSVVITDAAKTALLARLKATALEGGDFSSPEQKSAEIASIMLDVVTAVTPTG